MARNYATKIAEGLLVITEQGGTKSQVLKGKAADEINELLKQRKALGIKISEKLKEHGVGEAGNEETETIVD